MGRGMGAGMGMAPGSMGPSQPSPATGLPPSDVEALKSQIKTLQDQMETITEKLTALGEKGKRRKLSSSKEGLRIRNIPLNKFPFDIDSEFKKALQYHKSGQLQKAEEIYRRILDIKPNHSSARRELSAGPDAHRDGLVRVEPRSAAEKIAQRSLHGRLTVKPDLEQGQA